MTTILDDPDFTYRRQREARRAYARRPKKIADVVAQLLTKRGYGRHTAGQQLANAWAVAAGEQLASGSRPGRVRRGTLEVTVSNSTLMQEFTFHKQRILAELARAMPEAKISNLRFQVGQIS
jgi:predicted nucleic acid-binding Zn ribbon protein